MKISSIRYRGTTSNLLMALIYSLFYDYIFGSYTMPVWGYMQEDGGSYITMPTDKYILYILLCVVPFFFFRSITTIASIFSFFIYILVYVPFVDTLMTSGYPDRITIPYLIVFFVSMCFFFSTDRLVLYKNAFSSRWKCLPFKYLEWLTVIMTIVVLLFNLHHMRFVNILTESQLMYEKRGDAEVSMTYFLGWLRSALVPILMVYYLNNKSYRKYMLCMMAFLFFFMIDMLKSTFVIPFVMTILFILIKRNIRIFPKVHIYITCGIMALSLLVLSLRAFGQEFNMVAAVLLMRTICIEGFELPAYLNFFEVDQHPFTYFSHINLVNFFTHSNPYPESIGMAVTYGESNANATFWLMDGVAGAGVLGCFIISVIFVLFKSAFNGISNKCNLAIAIIIFLQGVNNVVNASLFTSLLTGGLIIIYLVFAFFDLRGLKELK